MRFSAANGQHPVTMNSSAAGVTSLIDISRTGLAVGHSSSLKVGDVIPVDLSYAGLEIKANAKVITATDRRAGAEFINLDEATANNLLKVNLLLEGDKMAKKMELPDKLSSNE